MPWTCWHTPLGPLSAVPQSKLDQLLGFGLAGAVQEQGDSGKILVEKFLALTHKGPRGDTPLAPLPILLALVSGPHA